MKHLTAVCVKVEHPDSSGLPGRAREILAEIIGWDEVRRLFPSVGDRRMHPEM